MNTVCESPIAPPTPGEILTFLRPNPAMNGFNPVSETELERTPEMTARGFLWRRGAKALFSASPGAKAAVDAKNSAHVPVTTASRSPECSGPRLVSRETGNSALRRGGPSSALSQEFRGQSHPQRSTPTDSGLQYWEQG